MGCGCEEGQGVLLAEFFLALLRPQVPTSVMLNWEMEFKKFCPAFKLLTYYGSAKERKAKRQGWSKPNSFHVCITSYTLILQDAKVAPFPSTEGLRGEKNGDGKKLEGYERKEETGGGGVEGEEPADAYRRPNGE